MPFELLDIYWGSFAATFFPDTVEDDINPKHVVLQDPDDQASELDVWTYGSIVPPEFTNHFHAVFGNVERTIRSGGAMRPLLYKELRLAWRASRVPRTRHGSARRELQRFRRIDDDEDEPQNYTKRTARALKHLIKQDLELRGIDADRIATLEFRFDAVVHVFNELKNGAEDIAAVHWDAKAYNRRPIRRWSREQTEVLSFMEQAAQISDANEFAGIGVLDRPSRLLEITGGPGTGKTEVLLEAAVRLSDHGLKVLLAGPIGLLVASYRLRIPPTADVVMETIHSAFKVTRKADEPYCPPGRLRHYDAILLDEISQIDSSVWGQLKTAIGELYPVPLIVFVGDHQQLQPVAGESKMANDLELWNSQNFKI